MKIVQIVDKIGDKEYESYEISIPIEYRTFVHIANGTVDGQRLILPRELLKQIIKEFD
jgi:hypothetical protein